MKKIIPALLSTLMLSVPTQNALAENGQQLHDQHCTQCHGSEVYTRKDRKMTTIEKLENQVTTCTTMLNLHWFPEQERPVVNFLNKKYYHF